MLLFIFPSLIWPVQVRNRKGKYPSRIPTHQQLMRRRWALRPHAAHALNLSFYMIRIGSDGEVKPHVTTRKMWLPCCPKTSQWPGRTARKHINEMLFIENEKRLQVDISFPNRGASSHDAYYDTISWFIRSLTHKESFLAASIGAPLIVLAREGHHGPWGHPQATTTSQDALEMRWLGTHLQFFLELMWRCDVFSTYQIIEHQ